MHKGCLISIGALFIIIFGFIWLVQDAFEPEYYTVELKQKIGGSLICETTYSADHHSWTYLIDYNYRDVNGNVYEIGNGSYDGRSWEKDEQLIKFDKWLVLKTGSLGDSDKILIGSLTENAWKEFEFSATSIERDSVWNSKDINSLLGWLPSKAFIDKIEDGKIYVSYEYRVDKLNTNATENRLVEYEIDKKIGIPKMTNVSLLN